MSDRMKAKIYKLLDELHLAMLNRILYRARNVKEYAKEDEPQKFIELVETITNKDRYDYTGIQSNEERRFIETLHYLLDDEQDIK